MKAAALDDVTAGKGSRPCTANPARMTWRRAAGAALLACALLAPPAVAGPLDPPSLVVSGSGPAMVRFTLRAPLQLDLRYGEVSTTGSYAGVFIQSASGGKDYGGVLWIQALDTSSVPAVPPVSRQAVWDLRGHFGPSPTLPAGAYRAYLLGDAETEVRVPLKRGSPLALRATLPSKQLLHTEVHELPADLDPDVDRFDWVHPFARPGDAFSFLYGQYTAVGFSNDVVVHVCAARKPSCGHTGVINGPGNMMDGATLVAATGVGSEPKAAGKWYFPMTVSGTDRGGGRVVLAYLQLVV